MQAGMEGRAPRAAPGKRGFVERHLYVPPLRRQQVYWAIAFISPALILYMVFMLYPFLTTIYLGFTNWNGATATAEFVGLSNFERMLGDRAVYTAFLNTVIWVVFGTLAPVILGLFLALLLWTGTQGSLIFRAVYFLPFVLPLVVVAIVWQWIYHPLFGPLNRMLDSVGLEQVSRGWLGEPGTALYAVLISAIPGAMGFVVVVLFAALQNVDVTQVEAAMLDGANWPQRAWYVIIPQIAPVITMVTSITLIGGFAVFDNVFVMTGGGPGHASEVLATYTYSSAFQQNQAGYGSALAILITVLSLISTVIFVRLRERQRYE
jgi:raffinose/stachyose/melibiose transport system permease protein